jgi:hypothetical protein
MTGQAKRPTWVTIVGVLGIIFGVFGLFGAGQVAMTPKMLQMQKKMMESMPMPTQRPAERESAEQFKKWMEGLWGDQPEWFAVACVGLGIAGLIVNGLYVFGAVTLLQLKPYAVTLFSLTLGASIALALARAVAFYMASSFFIGMALLFTESVSVVLDVVLLVVIATGDRSAFVTSPPGRVT